MVVRSGKNINGYFGETIDVAAVLKDCVSAARTHGWIVEDVPAGTTTSLLALRRPALPLLKDSGETGSPEGPRLYISAGIHGDEPAGPLAVRQLLQQNLWPPNLAIWLCPCLNPTGFASNRRENSQGVDLNREYLNPKADETLAHIGWLNRQPGFDACLCLHEDWESHGFYLYEQNPENRPSMAEAMLRKVAEVCPIDLSETIEGRPAQWGLIRPSVDLRSRPQWPEAFYLLSHKTRLSYTLEAPSDFPVASRVAALVWAVRCAAGLLAGG
jgi:protein MpaA